MNIIKNDIISLRAIEPKDVELIYEWENNSEIWQVSNTVTPFSRNIIQKYIESSHLDIYEAKQLRLMIDAKNISKNPITIGTIDLFDFDPQHRRAGIGILINDTKHRNKGYAKNALEVLIYYSFNVLLLHQLYCNITTNNEISLKLFQSLGFEKCGEKKDWIKIPNNWLDEVMLQLVNPDES